MSRSIDNQDGLVKSDRQDGRWLACPGWDPECQECMRETCTCESPGRDIPPTPFTYLATDAEWARTENGGPL